MNLPIFSKRHKKTVDRKDPALNLSIQNKQRVLYAMQEFNYDIRETNQSGWDDVSDAIHETGCDLVREHGWDRLKTWDASKKAMTDAEISEFLLGCAGHHILDAIELYSTRLREEKSAFQKEINRIFYEGHFSWRLVEDVIFRVDSEYMDEVYQCASQLLANTGFDGALEEFQKARSHLDSGDTKESVHHSNLSLESTMKSILKIEHEKPGKLIRLLIDSGIVPAYYDEFLKNFEQVLRSVNVARNEEKGAGHGQGAQVSEVPQPLAELVLNLCGALTVYLVRQHLVAAEKREPSTKAPAEDEIPF